jgi:hypothetical protein
MTSQEIQPQGLSTGRGNFLAVMLNLATGQTQVLDDAEAARAAAEATRRQASRSSDLLMLSTSAA